MWARGPTRQRPWDWDELAALALREARRVLPGEADAEDAAQEAIIRAYRAQGGCDNPTAPQSWVRTIARREAIRLSGRRREHPLDELVDAGAGSDDVVQRVIEHIAIEDTLRDVSQSDRSLLIRRYVFDQTSAEIAADLTLPAATVRVRLHRAAKRLRERSHAEL